MRRTLMGTLLGIATRPASRAPMETAEQAAITTGAGVARDRRRSGKRQVTVLAREGWVEACRSVRRDLPWTTRRANLYVEGVGLAGATGRILRVGEVLLEVTGETGPCERMEEQCAGLREALMPAWRGGVTCRVLEGGTVAVGDPVSLEEPS